MLQERVSRRRWIKIAGGTIAGLAFGAAVGYLSAPIKFITETITETVTETVTVTPPLTPTPTPIPTLIKFYLPKEYLSEYPMYDKILLAKRPELKIEYMPEPQIADVLFLSGAKTIKLIVNDVLLPIENFAGTEILTKYHERLFNPFMGPDGKLYGIPWRWSTLFLLYNEDVFAEAGLRGPPRTWDELFAYAETITSETMVPGFGVIPHGFDLYMAYALSQGAPRPIFIGPGDPEPIPPTPKGKNYIPDDPDPPKRGKDWFDDPRVEGTLREWISLLVKGREAGYVVSPYDVGAETLTEAFIDGKLGMIISNNFEIPFIVGNFNWDMAPLPAGTKYRATIVHVIGLGVSPITADPESSWALIEALAGEYGQIELTVERGFALPTITKLLPNVWSQQKEALDLLIYYDRGMIWFTGLRHVDLIPKLESILLLTVAGELSVDNGIIEMHRLADEVLG